MDKEKFGRYLLRELLWEASISGMTIPDLGSIPPEQIQVLAYSGYNSLRFRMDAVVYDAHLSWRRDVPPLIAEAEVGLGSTPSPLP